MDNHNDTNETTSNGGKQISTEIIDSLDKVLDFLEPIPFSIAKIDGLYETFLHEWGNHVRAKMNDCSLVFDESLVFGKSQKPEEIKAVKLIKDEYKVVSTDVLSITASVIGYPIALLGGKFRIYTGKYWQAVDDAILTHYCRKMAIKMSVARLVAPESKYVKSMLDQIASTSSRVTKGMARNLMNFQNGTLEFYKDGSTRLRNHDSNDKLMYVLPYDYDPNATCPKWQKFLDEVIPEEGKQAVLAEFLGSCFSDVKHEKIMLLYGSGANGKSVVNEVVNRLYGKENLTSKTLEEITDSKGYNRGALMESLLNYAGEISKKVNPDALKKLASREPLTGRYVYGRPFEVTDYCRSAFNCNVLPEVTEASDGFFRRFLIIPFEYTVPKDKRNPHLPAEIAETDLPGIMNWVIAGLQRLVKAEGKFTYCPAADAILAQYQATSRNVELFVTDVIGNSKELYPASTLYAKYTGFCSDNEYTPVTVKEFSTQLQDLGFNKTRRSNGVCYQAR